LQQTSLQWSRITAHLAREQC